MDSDDDIPQLSADTLALLREFRQDEDARKEQFKAMQSQAENQFQSDSVKLSMSSFNEDWNASQFWYTDETARTLARQLLKDVKEDSAIAVVSAPSVYVALRNLVVEMKLTFKPRIVLLEFDQRFNVFGSEFVFYNYEKPLQLPQELKGTFDRMICDPPFLSEDCQTKAAMTARFLAKTWPVDGSASLRFITCTGERCGPVLSKLYGKIGLNTTTFEPKHSKGLSNEFFCYSNFECEDWTWRQE